MPLLTRFYISQVVGNGNSEPSRVSPHIFWKHLLSALISWAQVSISVAPAPWHGRHMASWWGKDVRLCHENSFWESELLASFRVHYDPYRGFTRISNLIGISITSLRGISTVAYCNYCKMGSFSLFKIINQVLDTTQSAKCLTGLKGIRISIPHQTLIQNCYTPKKTNGLNLKMAVSQSPFPRIYFSVNHGFFSGQSTIGWTFRSTSHLLKNHPVAFSGPFDDRISWWNKSITNKWQGVLEK